MTPPETTLTNTSVCPRCGAGLRCGMVAGDAECWCVKLPFVMPVPSMRAVCVPLETSAASCFCPTCLKQITDERQHPLSTPRD